ncbi:MAG: SDR family oxidoreductase [Actinobacteria bacterium]|nr:SDR family oxidoreductase [Actinomycetota bacterium]
MTLGVVGSLKDKPVIVTGGASGIGAATALLAAGAGAPVGVLDINAAGADEVAESCRKQGSSAVGIECDVSSETSVAGAVAHCVETLGVPHGLVAAAGVDAGGLVHQMDEDDWAFVLGVNATGAFLTAKHVTSAMLAEGAGGSIVLVSSAAAFVSFGAGKMGAYAASKGAVSALARAMAVDYGSLRIRVNALVPGATETPLMWSNVPTGSIAEARKEVSREVPLGRLATPEEPAHAALWLLSDDSSYVTGGHLVCDGGMLAKSCVPF